MGVSSSYSLSVSRYTVYRSGREVGVIIPTPNGWQFVSREFPFYYLPARTPGLALSYFIDQEA